MYGFIFRSLPGPTWFRLLLFLLLIAAAVAALFLWVFPWLSEYIRPFTGSTVNTILL